VAWQRGRDGDRTIVTSLACCPSPLIFHFQGLSSIFSHFSVKTKLESFFKPALLSSKASTTSESSIGE
jgi:hypothetical protein